jgi:hypothetical protein
LVDLINQKRAGKPITPKERPAAGNVVDLMEALRRSAGGGAAEKAARVCTSTSPLTALIALAICRLVRTRSDRLHAQQRGTFGGHFFAAAAGGGGAGRPT